MKSGLIGPDVWPRTNSLLSPLMILAKACWLMRQTAPDGPFEATVRLAFPSAALTYAIDDFWPEYLQPAVAAAVRHTPAGPDDGSSDLPGEWHSQFFGIDAHQRLCYNIDEDLYRITIDMRVE